MTGGPRVERRLVGLLSGLLLGDVAFVAARGLGLGGFAAVVLAVGVAAIGFWRLPRLLPEQLDGALRRYPLVSAVWLGFLLWCIVDLGRLSWFMVEPSAVQHSVLPSSGFMVRHNCLTAYLEGARFAASEPNCYESSLYRPAAAVRKLDGFDVDPYLYPPPFLLLPAGVRLLAVDFLHRRMLWYAIDLSCVVAAMLVLAHWIGGNRGLVVGLLTPAVLVSVPTRISLQIGNFQLMAAAFAVLAMVAFERRRTVGGAALLAFAAIAKLFPGVLLIYLLGRRRFRAVALTFGFIALYAALTLLVFGSTPFRSFVDSALPAIASGREWGQTPEAPWLKLAPWGVAINQSVPGLMYKLGLLGAPPAKLFVAAKVFAWIFTLALIVTAFLLGRATQGERLQSAQTWLALLGLASLQAPFLPQEYALFLPLWLLAVVAAGIDAGQKRPQVMAALVGWAGLNLLLEDTSFGWGLVPSLIMTTIPQAIAWGLLAAVAVHAMRKGRSHTAQAATSRSAT